MTIRNCIWCCCVLMLFSCRKDEILELPEEKWELFESPAARELPSYTHNKMEGIYQVVPGNTTFGEASALKWTYQITGTDTSYFVSLFCAAGVTYMVCEGKRLDSAILLSGYWRNLTNTDNGKIQLTINAAAGATNLLAGVSGSLPDSVVITGLYSNGNGTPDIPVQLRYQRPLHRSDPFEIVAHRGGGRTSDLLPASENSVELIRLASRFGATGIEIDVRLTKDGVPVLLHDATLNERIIQSSGLVGPVENYTFEQLDAIVRLTQGEHIPTLRQALNTVVYETPLRFVWLDTKFKGRIDLVRSIQQEYLQKAVAAGRQLELLIGIPDDDVKDNFLKLADYAVTPAVCELSPEDVTATNARIWAPRWTLGLQNDIVDQVHAQNRRAFVWTLDEPANIDKYMTQGKFDGILSNYPSAVAYDYYVQQ